MGHVEDPYNKENKPNIDIEKEEEVDDDNIGPNLLDREMESAIKEFKNGKAF